MRKITVIIFSLLLLVGCSQSSVQQNTELEESIHSILEDKSITEININALTNFDWNKAFLFAPYTTQEGIEEQLGIDFKDPSKIDIRDDIYLLVFLHDKREVHYAEINHQQSDFSIGGKEYLTPTNASINIDR